MLPHIERSSDFNALLAAFGRGGSADPASDRTPPPPIHPAAPVTDGCLSQSERPARLSSQNRGYQQMVESRNITEGCFLVDDSRPGVAGEEEGLEVYSYQAMSAARMGGDGYHTGGAWTR